MKATESQAIVEFVRRFLFKPRYCQCLADMSRFAFYVLKTLFMLKKTKTNPEHCIHNIYSISFEQYTNKKYLKSCNRNINMFLDFKFSIENISRWKCLARMSVCMFKRRFILSNVSLYKTR